MITVDGQLSQAFDRTPHPSSLRARLAAANRALTGMVDALLDWSDRIRQRRQLLGLADAALRDFAASRADAAAEANKPFWRQ